MHWISIAALVSASLFPVASGSPGRPHSTTTSGISTTAVSVESSSIATVENPTTVTTTAAADVTTKATEATTTTNAESTTAEELTSTTKAETTSAAEASTTTTAETTTAEATTTTTDKTTTAEAISTTTTAAAGPTNAVQNGGFEDVPNTAWVLQGSTIADTGLAHTGTHFLQISVSNNVAIGQNSATQIINGLDTTLSYQLAFYYAIFSNPAPVIIPGTVCLLQVEKDSSVIAQPFLNFASLDSYQQFSINTTPTSDSLSLTIRLRCTNSRRVTVALGIDDVSIYSN
ncbi:hypothetical protein FANTH_1949 [Fusarium anthophilum]|uniref:CBM-cenC domain-containing protein n=1 Tax=Fusarium anthophilum TaxID=48485 RepID=A0A8H4ZUN5_9HYPO|nr:hypothetical protein FANTH_1949 [Fusarium anthophilum]